MSADVTLVTILSDRQLCYDRSIDRHLLNERVLFEPATATSVFQSDGDRTKEERPHTSTVPVTVSVNTIPPLAKFSRQASFRCIRNFSGVSESYKEHETNENPHWEVCFQGRISSLTTSLRDQSLECLLGHPKPLPDWIESQGL